MRRLLPVRVLFAAACVVCAPQALAQMTITPANSGRGFVLSTYSTGFPNAGVPSTTGPIGIAFRDDMGPSVLVSDPFNETVYDFPNHLDNQIAGPILASYGPGLAPRQFAQVQVGGVWRYYTTIQGDLVEYDVIGGNVGLPIAAVGGGALVPFPPNAGGIRAGHIFVAGSSNVYGGAVIWDFDPVTQGISAWKTGPDAQALAIAFSEDGTRLYTTFTDQIQAIDVASTAVIWTGPSHATDGYAGIAVGLGTLKGYVYVNTLSGKLYEFGEPGGPYAGVDNLLASGGTAGLHVASDNDVKSGGVFPSLLITQQDRILRLDPPGSGWLGPPTSSTLVVGGTTSVPGRDDVVELRRLSVRPNPSAGPVELAFALESQGIARLAIHDLQGREIARLADGLLEAGVNRAMWSARDGLGRAPAGIYFARLTTRRGVVVRRFALTP